MGNCICPRTLNNDLRGIGSLVRRRLFCRAQTRRSTQRNDPSVGMTPAMSRAYDKCRNGREVFFEALLLFKNGPSQIKHGRPNASFPQEPAFPWQRPSLNKERRRSV